MSLTVSATQLLTNVFRPLPLECPEAGDGAEHGAARVRDELLAHRLRPPVHVLYGVLECATPGENNNSYNYNNNNVHIPSPCRGGRCSGCRSPG